MRSSRLQFLSIYEGIQSGRVNSKIVEVWRPLRD
jgi:hypothetical protein